MFSDRWILAVAAATVEVDLAADEGLALKAPPRFRAFDTAYKAGLRHYKSSMDLYRRGVDARSATLIQQANSQMLQGQAAMATATTEIKALLPP